MSKSIPDLQLGHIPSPTVSNNNKKSKENTPGQAFAKQEPIPPAAARGCLLLFNHGLHHLFLFVSLINNRDVESLKAAGGPTWGRQDDCTKVALGLI